MLILREFYAVVGAADALSDCRLFERMSVDVGIYSLIVRPIAKQGA
jgi:hypothetical protein